MMEVYLPHHMLPKDEDVTFEEFFEYLAKAEYVRDLQIEDVYAGMMKALNAFFNEDE